jgi:ADP-ribosyl-[dinitrogen reductase] hydrolase
MALRLAESLAACQCFDAKDVLARYVEWWREDGVDSGPTAGGVLERVSQGMPVDRAVKEVDELAAGQTAGCNPAHRCAPLAMASFIADEDLVSVAIAEASLTHRHNLAGDTAAAVAVLCRSLIRGEKWEQALQRAAQGRTVAVQVALLNQATEQNLNAGGYAPDVLRAAVYFLSAHDDFGSALKASLAFAGAENYCPVLVGSIGGARWGVSDIVQPTRQLGERVRSVTTRLAAAW